MINNQRIQMRQYYLKKRTQLNQNNRQQATQSIINQLNHYIKNQTIEHIGSYAAHNEEIDLSSWLKKQSAKIYLPRILPQRKMIYCPLHGQLQTNQFGIAEPQTDAIALNILDVVFVPLIAFNQQCARLGYGAGYFDRCFAYKKQKPEAKPTLIGIAMASQQAIFKTEPWDVHMDCIITDQGIIYPNDDRPSN